MQTKTAAHCTQKWRKKKRITQAHNRPSRNVAEIRKENQTNEIYFSSYFNSHTPQTEREYHDSGAVGVGGCLRFRVDEFFSLDSFIDFHACLLLQKPT